MPASGATFEERAAEVVDYFANVNYTRTGTPKFTFFYAEAKFYDYEVNRVTRRLAEARDLVNAGLDNLDGNDPPFQLWRAMDCYLRWGHLFDPALKEKFKSRMVASPEYDYHNTQNKIWMAAAARFLAGETWPGAQFGSGYSPSDPTGRAALLAKMESLVHEGETEHNSPTYIAMHYGALRSLADFAKDPGMKRRAALSAEWLLASAAAEWLGGTWCAPAQRIYGGDAFGSQSTYGSSNHTLRLFFGGPTPTNWNPEIADAVQSVCSAYRPPAMLVSIAQDRTASYTHQETHRDVGTVFYCTTYMTREYSLYSEHETFSDWGSGGGMDQVQIPERPPEIVADIKADGNGRFTFSPPGPGKYYVAATSADSRNVRISDSIRIGGGSQPVDFLNIILDTAGFLEGKVILPADPGFRSLALAGTHFSALPDSLGRFRFPPLPGGSYRLLARYSGGDGPPAVLLSQFSLEEGQTLALDSLPVRQDRVLLFDFEDGRSRNALRGIVYPDTGSRTDLGGWEPLPVTLDSTEARAGKSMHIELPDTAAFQGFFLGSGYYDLSRMQAFTFRGKGQGMVRFYFSTELSKDGQGSFQAVIQLSPSWTVYTIRPEDLRPTPGSYLDSLGYTWEDAKRRVIRAVWKAEAGPSDLWLDDIFLEGMNYDDF